MKFMKKSARKADERQIKKKLFDSKQKKIYEQEIEPLIVQLKERCRQNKMPFFVSVCIDATDPLCLTAGMDTDIINPTYKNTYMNELVTPYQTDMKLYPDYIAEFIKIINGFHAVPPQEPISQDELTFMDNEDCEDISDITNE